MLYIIPILLFLIGIFLYDYFEIKRGRLFLWLFICVYLIILAGLRYRLGEDTLHYMRYYDQLEPLYKLKASDFENSRYAPGFIIIMSFFKSFSNDITAFQIFQATFVNSIFFYFIIKHTKHIFFAGLIYYFFLYILYSFLQLREAMAVSLFLLAWPFFRNGQWVKWYLTAIIAFSFHLSATIMFLVPLICVPGIKSLFIFGKRTWFILTGIVIVSFLIYKLFFNFIQIISISEKMTERAEAYSKHELGGMLLNFKGVIMVIIGYIIYPILALYFKEKGNVQHENHNKFNKFNAFILISVYVTIFSIFITVMQRYTNYFFPFVILLLSDWIFSRVKIKEKRRRFGFVAWMIFFMPMFIFQGYSMTLSKINKSGTLRTYMLYYPYSSALDKSKDLNREKVIRYIYKRGD